MPKVLWVALPLLITAAWFAVQVLRGRPPSRLAVNIGASLLLMIYVAATAGLGIFWVANQQLPVFDWHYLFGYGTVLLVLLHLVFNFPVVWRFLLWRGKPGPALLPAGAAVPQRSTRRGVLGLLGTLGAIAASGAAFMFGLRHGRTELTVGLPAGRAASPVPTEAADPGGDALAVVERFHAFSAHSRAGVLTRAPSVDWGDPPEPFKGYPGAQVVRLPSPGSTRATPFDLHALADILWFTCGVTEKRGGLHLRASPSSGALFSTELYVVARAVPGLGAGPWHHDAEKHRLEKLHQAAQGLRLADAIADASLNDAPALVVATAVFRRTGYKYRDRTYRYVLADLGHALENLRVAADALGVSARFVAAFDESRVAQALGIDEAEEGVLAMVALGAPLAAPLPDAMPASADAAPRAVLPRWPAPSMVSSGAPLGVTAAVHAATSLRAASAPATAAAVPQRSHTQQSLVALPKAVPTAPDWLAVIGRRRSVRRYADQPLPLQALADVLSRMATFHRPVLSPAVRIDLVVHDVAGLPPGSYRYLPDRHALRPHREPAAQRTASRAAALDQDVIGDAAVVFVLAIDRTSFAADPLGPARGYRHAFLEAGLVGERIYLEAGARGLGACAVGAFYDDEAAALVGVDPELEWIVHFAALGVKG